MLWGLECCLWVSQMWSAVPWSVERWRSDRPEPTLLLQTTVDPSYLANVLLHPLFFLVAFWKIHSFNHRVHLFQRRRLTHAPLVSHNFIGPKNKTRPAVTWTMLLCMYGPPFCRSQDIPGVSADIPSRSVAPVPVYACQPPAIHHPRLAGPGTLDQPVGNCSLSLITSLQL